MIGKIKYGTSFSSVVEYSLQPHKGELLDKNMAGRTPAELNKEFQLCSSLNYRTDKPCARFIIGISKDDAEKLNQKQLQDITKIYLKKMGYENHPYLAAIHSDT
jgi:hypothetical protein